MGSKIKVKKESPGGTHRTPKYIMGKTGIITASHGIVPGYEIDHREDWGNLYTVEFDIGQISGIKGRDKILVDVHEDWIEIPRRKKKAGASTTAKRKSSVRRR